LWIKRGRLPVLRKTIAKGPCEGLFFWQKMPFFLPRLSLIYDIKGLYDLRSAANRRIISHQPLVGRQRLIRGSLNFPGGYLFDWSLAMRSVRVLTFLTPQQIFDRSARHLLTQGKAALLPRGGGAYRGFCGGCPVGSFLTPRDHVTAMEGLPVRHLAADPRHMNESQRVGIEALRAGLLRAGVNANEKSTVDLLSCLQNVHDVFGIWEWKERLTSIARQFGLNTDVLSAEAATPVPAAVVAAAAAKRGARAGV